MKDMKVENKIGFTDVYTMEDLLARVPFYAPDTMTIKVSTYGYLHDVGTIVTLTKSQEPTGWDTLQHDLQEAIDTCKTAWKLAAAAGYHGGM